MFQLLDHYTASVSVMIMAFAEVAAIIWIFGESEERYSLHQSGFWGVMLSDYRVMKYSSSQTLPLMYMSPYGL